MNLHQATQAAQEARERAQATLVKFHAAQEQIRQNRTVGEAHVYWVRDIAQVVVCLSILVVTAAKLLPVVLPPSVQLEHWMTVTDHGAFFLGLLAAALVLWSQQIIDELEIACYLELQAASPSSDGDSSCVEEQPSDTTTCSKESTPSP